MFDGVAYVIKYRKQYVKLDCTGHIKLVNNIALADTFEWNKGKNIINNSISKGNRKHYKLISYNAEMNNIDNNEIQNENEDLGLHYTRLTEIVTDDETMKNFEFKSLKDYTEQGIDLNNISNIISNLSPIQEWLEKQLREIEMKITDVEHRIEFPKSNGKEFNAFEMFNFTKMQRDLLRDRRLVKNDLLKISILQSFVNMDEIDKGRLSKRINGVDNQKYKPRILTTLFETA